jgi:hypothetical protein
MNIADTTHAPERAQRAKVPEGSCFCGAVRFTVTGEPAVMGYCHCESCRHWSAGPVNAFTLWNPEALEFVQGADSVGTYSRTPNSFYKVVPDAAYISPAPRMGLVDVARGHTGRAVQAGRAREHRETKLRILMGFRSGLTGEFGGSGYLLQE